MKAEDHIKHAESLMHQGDTVEWRTMAAIAHALIALAKQRGGGA
jgi:hypothetical protein